MVKLWKQEFIMNWGKKGGQLGRFAFGERDKAKQFDMLSPEQMQLLQSVMQSLMGGEGQFGDLYGVFDPQKSADIFQQGVANPAMRNFQQQVIPGIQQAFADQGASSGLNNSLATAGRDLSENLNSQLAMFINQQNQQQNQNRMQGLNLGLGTQQFGQYIQGGNGGFVPGILNSFAEGAGKGLTGWMTGGV
jgi:hypothetical protein